MQVSRSVAFEKINPNRQQPDSRTGWTQYRGLVTVAGAPTGASLGGIAHPGPLPCYTEQSQALEYDRIKYCGLPSNHVGSSDESTCVTGILALSVPRLGGQSDCPVPRQFLRIKEFLAFPGVKVTPPTTQRFVSGGPGTACSRCSLGGIPRARRILICQAFGLDLEHAPLRLPGFGGMRPLNVKVSSTWSR